MHAAQSRMRKEEAKAITVSAARHPQMLEPQPDDDVEESVTSRCGEETVISVAAGVAAAMFAFGLLCLMSGVLSRFLGNFLHPPPFCFIFSSKHSVLLFSITCAALAVALRRLRELTDDASRTGVTDHDRENESINQLVVHNDIEEEASHSPKKNIEEARYSRKKDIEEAYCAADQSLLITRGDDVGERQMDSTWWADGAVWASLAGLQVGGESHHRKSTERGREVEMSGKAVSDGKGKNA